MPDRGNTMSRANEESVDDEVEREICDAHVPKKKVGEQSFASSGRGRESYLKGSKFFRPIQSDEELSLKKSRKRC